MHHVCLILVRTITIIRTSPKFHSLLTGGTFKIERTLSHSLASNKSGISFNLSRDSFNSLMAVVSFGFVVVVAVAWAVFGASTVSVALVTVPMMDDITLRRWFESMRLGGRRMSPRCGATDHASVERTITFRTPNTIAVPVETLIAIPTSTPPGFICLAVAVAAATDALFRVTNFAKTNLILLIAHRSSVIEMTISYTLPSEKCQKTFMMVSEFVKH